MTGTLLGVFVLSLVACDGSAAAPRAIDPSQTTGSSRPRADDGETAGPYGGLEVRWLGGTDGLGGGDGPVVVVLHGYGAPGDDLVPLARSLRAPQGTRFLLPVAPIALHGPGARAWWHLDVDRFRRRYSGSPDDATTWTPEGLAAARARMRALLAHLELRGTPPSEVVLVGFSQGAMLAMDSALHADDDMAGVVVMSGGLVASAQWVPRMRARRAVPVLISHGRADPLLPFFMSEQLHRRLSEAGFAVERVSFEGGHTIAAVVPPRVSAFLERVLAR